MVVIRRLCTAILFLNCFIQLAVFGLPVRNSREPAVTGATDDDFNWPSGVNPVEEKDRSTNSCYVVITKRYNESTGEEGDEIKPTNVTVRKCCEGYTGIECNIISDPYLASSPCSSAICPNFPEAICTIITRCGQDTPVFLNEEGEVVDCGQHQPSEGSNTTVSTPPDIDTLSCTGVCPNDPCVGLTCPAHPEAWCLTVGCSCQPVWLLETGVSINCTTGDAIEPEVLQANRRRRRQVAGSDEATMASCSR